MNRWMGLALLLLVAGLFLVANRGAYKSYFQDDELDNISWAPETPASVYVIGLITPKFMESNFRPVGHVYFRWAYQAFGMDFPKYLIPIHLLHFLNVWLVWVLARRLGLAPRAAGVAALFFSFHMAVFDVYWKPMYVFDVLCCTFSLLCVIFWTRRHWLLGFVCFWLAYKAKELAVMLPAVLACYEYWLGKRRWKPLVPLFLVSLSFGLQGVLLNPNQDNDYTFRFTPAALLHTTQFYSGRIFLIPWAGLLLAGLAALRDRRVWFALAAALLWFVPLLFLPGRLFGAYCYLPLAVIAVALGAASARVPAAVAAGLLALWIPWNYHQLRRDRRQALAIADENRNYVRGLTDLARRSPESRVFVYQGRPEALHEWGIVGALRRVFGAFDVAAASAEDQTRAAGMLAAPAVAVLSWDPAARQLVAVARQPGAPDASFIRLDRRTPLWQLGKGWYGYEEGFRWSAPQATARLSRPPDARRFAVTLSVTPNLGRTEIAVSLDGREIGAAAFEQTGPQTAAFDVPAGPAGPVEITLRASHTGAAPSGDSRALGAAVISFGFTPPEEP